MKVSTRTARFIYEGDNFWEVPSWWEWKRKDKELLSTRYASRKEQEKEEYWRGKYPYPFHLVKRKRVFAFPFRVLRQDESIFNPIVKQAVKEKLVNAIIVEFRAERLCTFPDIQEIYSLLDHEERGRIKREQRKVREKVEEARKLNLEVIFNLNVLSFFPSATYLRRKFFEKFPEANPWFLGYAEEEEVPTSICPEHSLYLRMVASQIKELLSLYPEVKFIMLTIDDNGGYIRCRNPSHKHKNYERIINRERKAIEIINTVYEIGTSLQKIYLLLRCWGATLFLKNKRKFQKYAPLLPKERVIIMGKLNAPPSIDNAPLSSRLNPGLEYWPSVGISASWGEDGGRYNFLPLLYLYSNPRKIQRDLQRLVINGKVKLFISYVGSLPTQELDSLVLNSSRFSPFFSLSALKKEWAKYRFGKGGELVIKGLSLTPKILKKLTFYHRGRLQRNSLHLVIWGGVRSGESVFQVPPPKWMVEFKESELGDLKERVDATSIAKDIIFYFEKARELEPENEWIKLFLEEAYLTYNLTQYFKWYHWAFLEYVLFLKYQKKDPQKASSHLQNSLSFWINTYDFIKKYEDSLTLRWQGYNRRRYFVDFALWSYQIIRDFLQEEWKKRLS